MDDDRSKFSINIYVNEADRFLSTTLFDVMTKLDAKFTFTVGDGYVLETEDLDIDFSKEDEIAITGDLVIEEKVYEARDENSLERRLEKLLNEFSLDSASDTPDYLLAKYVLATLEVFSKTIKARARWYGDKSV